MWGLFPLGGQIFNESLEDKDLGIMWLIETFAMRCTIISYNYLYIYICTYLLQLAI